MAKNLTLTEAQALAHRLRCEISTGELLFATIQGDRIAFVGGRHGQHSLAFEVSTAVRVKAHWAGYCENNGYVRPKIGQTVLFPSSSSPSGRRFGRVISAGPDNLRIQFRYYNGGVSVKTVPVHQCRVLG